MYDRNWAKIDVNSVPRLVTTLPGPKSRSMHARAAEYMKGYSSQVRLFPVVFESGHGCTLTDADGNVYIDFSSGIYVTGRPSARVWPGFRPDISCACRRR
jgi:4-aminobutyrate aminotransferase-like enzyme